MNEKILLTSLLITTLIPTLAYAGTKTKTFSYNNELLVEGKLTTICSVFGNNQGYASTKITKGSSNISTYIESQDKANGSRTDWATSSTSNPTRTISRKRVWRFNSTHSIVNSKGSTLASATQTDW